MTDIPEELKQKYKWIPNTSMTFMEILHGAYRYVVGVFGPFVLIWKYFKA